MIELPTLEGMLCFDGRVLELFRNDGRESPWRLHGALIIDIEQERRSDRIHVRFHTTPKFYESAELTFDGEPLLQKLLKALDSARR